MTYDAFTDDECEKYAEDLDLNVLARVLETCATRDLRS